MRARAAELTVIIPTSGRWEVLGRTLDALDAQSVTGFATVVVVNSLELAVPDAIRRHPRLIVEAKVDEGPGVARNQGLARADTELVLFLGDDTLPAPELVARHLDRHGAEPRAELAVLGKVVWHPEVAANRFNAWLEWSGLQSDYAALDAQLAAAAAAVRAVPDADVEVGRVPFDAGFGRFYTSNVSLKRAFCEPFDPSFAFGYEDIDLGWRLAQRGMVLAYEPEALALHVHAHTLDSLKRRFELIGEAEARMAAKHAWFEPWFLPRFLDAGRGASPFWALIHDRIPANLERLWWPIHARAERYYLQALAPSFLTGWGRGGGPGPPAVRGRR